MNPLKILILKYFLDFFAHVSPPPPSHVAGNATVLQQVEGDLGQRMAAAFEAQLLLAQSVVIVGSDCPFIDGDYLQQAYLALAPESPPTVPLVVGPATDGGYVLIGLNRPAPALFSGVSWGGERVYQQTCDRASRLGWRWHSLAMQADIDRPDDLRLLEQAGLSMRW